MTDQIAVGVHAGPGDELIYAATSHVYVREGDGKACDDVGSASLNP